ncbi:MAG: hypothetical protein GY946_26260 [bacterium]|nr:hypothetical protein [bacterium]
MTDRESPLHGDAPDGEDPIAPFRPGTRVALSQYAPTAGPGERRELGVGEILAIPRIGERLELRIRAERGLASSPVRELRLVGEGCLAVLTHSRIYLLSLLEGGVRPPDATLLRAYIDEMFAGLATGGEPPEEVTEYVRIGEPLVRPGASEFRGRLVRIEREDIGDPDAKPELLGSGRLLGEPEPGLALRFQDADGQVVATSVVVAVERSGAHALEASTTNGRYRFELELESESSHGSGSEPELEPEPGSELEPGSEPDSGGEA